MIQSGNDILHLLHRASQSADDLLAHKINELDVTPRQLTVLAAVEVLADSSQAALVDSTGIDRSTLADIVRRLVNAGFLKRQRSQRDARMYAVRLTQQGLLLLEKARPMRQAVARDVLEALSASERPEFVEGLSRLVQTLGPVASARVSPRSKVGNGA